MQFDQRVLISFFKHIFVFLEDNFSFYIVLTKYVFILHMHTGTGSL